MDRPPLMYLASPFTHADPKVRAERAAIVTRIAGDLMVARRIPVFSPIAYGFPVAMARPEAEREAFELDDDLWTLQLHPYLMACGSFGIVRLDGWERSRGCAYERGVVTGRGLAVEYIDP